MLGAVVESHYEALGEREGIMALASTFYDVMERDEPELTALHKLDAPGKISAESRENFGVFLVFWLGGPDDYLRRRGHPRLRMRHGHVPVDVGMRDAWLRCMSKAMDEHAVSGPVREFLDQRLAEVADFLRNRPG
jgi:hemoglobin